MINKLEQHKEVWQEKTILKEVYADWYKRILRDLKPGDGKTLELGAGSGNFKEFKPDVIASDIVECDWLDMCFDAHSMPFNAGSVANIVMVDVLHHLADPIGFIVEAARVLERSGRLILVEPFPSLFSLAIYRIFHPEPFLMNVDYFGIDGNNKKDPWQANQAIAYLLFYRNRKRFLSTTDRKFKFIKRIRMGCILYPLSGGFEHKALIPELLIRPARALDTALQPLNRLLAFRCYVVLERQ